MHKFYNVSVRTLISLITAFLLYGCGSEELQQNDQTGTDEEWISLFNGEDIDDWIPKFTGYEVGENVNNTFRVEDGILKVSYDGWDEFNGEFGHLFYKEPFSHYILRVEYRFVDQQVDGGEDWAFRNNGLMLHSQDPATMTRDQEFPVSVETQLLGGDGENERTTGNICTPGTHIVKDDERITDHCINSSSKTYHGDQWITLEIEVRGSEVVRNSIDGETIFEYNKPQLDENDSTAKQFLDENEDLLLEEGYIAIQAESHPTEFRKIELKPLSE